MYRGSPVGVAGASDDRPRDKQTAWMSESRPARGMRRAGLAATVSPCRLRAGVPMNIISARMTSNHARTRLKAVASVVLLSACIVVGRADKPTVAASAGSEPRSLVSALTPRAIFSQLGVADEVTAGTIGAIWNPWDFHSPRWNAYLEASISRGQSRGGYPEGNRRPDQVHHGLQYQALTRVRLTAITIVTAILAATLGRFVATGMSARAPRG